MLFKLSVFAFRGIGYVIFANFLDSRVQDRVDSVSIELGLGILRDRFTVCIQDMIPRLDNVHFCMLPQDLGELYRLSALTPTCSTQAIAYIV